MGRGIRALGVVVAAAVVLAGCGSDSRTPGPHGRSGGDGAWTLSGEVRDLEVIYLGPLPPEAGFPSELAVSEVDGGIVAASVAARDGGVWELPQAAETRTAARSDGTVVTFATRDLDAEQLDAVVDGSDPEELRLPGRRIGTLRTADLHPLDVEASTSEAFLVTAVLMTATDEQLAVLEAVSGFDPNLPTASVPNAVREPDQEVSVGDRRGTVTALNGWARMLVVPGQPNLVVIGYAAGGEPDLGTERLVALAAAAELGPG